LREPQDLSVPSASLQQLLFSGRKRHFDKGDIILSSDEKHSISFLKEGFVKRYMIGADGSKGVQAIYGKGEIFPLTALFKKLLNRDIYRGPEVYYYEAMCPVVIYSLDESDLINAAHSNPLIYKYFLYQAGERLSSNIQKLENIAIKNSVKRVAHQLLYFAKNYGDNSLFGLEIMLPLTQQDIADVLSLTRETVSQSISVLRKKGLLTTEGGIVIKDIDALENEAFS
jgi:CRP-like cAMP-binding protein